MIRKLIQALLIGNIWLGGMMPEKEMPSKDPAVDYLVLVNRTHKLPDGWEEQIELVEAENIYGETFLLEKETFEHFVELRQAVLEKGLDIELESTYRTIEEQQTIWDEWTELLGKDYVEAYVAVPGYSEHHTGLAIDVCLDIDGQRFNMNDQLLTMTEQFEIMNEELAENGFILRFPKEKEEITGYHYEPWHIRYVGKEAAIEMDKQDLTLEEYLDEVEERD